LKPETIYYDGHCGLCHGLVKFVLARDKNERYHFAPLDRLSADERRGLPDSIVVRAERGVLVKSDAALYVLKGLGGAWALLASCARVFPRFLRDFVYDFVARVRYRVFGTRDDMCPIVPPELRKRFET
jgi:predicted DCC family thiol-disulfide oxidoreductase YuxK